MVFIKICSYLSITFVQLNLSITYSLAFNEFLLNFSLFLKISSTAEQIALGLFEGIKVAYSLTKSGIDATFVAISGIAQLSAYIAG